MTCYNKPFLIFATLCIVVISCKLDDPLIPVPNPNFNSGGTVLGISVFNKTVSDSYLSNLWTVSSTVKQYYDSSNVVISGTSVPNRFTSISLNDNTKTFVFTNGTFLYADEKPTGLYRLYTTDNVLFIQLATNVFFDSAHSSTRITNLTTRAMTWIAIDTNTVVVNGKPAHEAYQVIFAR